METIVNHIVSELSWNHDLSAETIRTVNSWTVMIPRISAVMKYEPISVPCDWHKNGYFPEVWLQISEWIKGIPWHLLTPYQLLFVSEEMKREVASALSYHGCIGITWFDKASMNANEIIYVQCKDEDSIEKIKNEKFLKAYIRNMKFEVSGFNFVI